MALPIWASVGSTKGSRQWGACPLPWAVPCWNVSAACPAAAPGTAALAIARGAALALAKLYAVLAKAEGLAKPRAAFAAAAAAMQASAWHAPGAVAAAWPAECGCAAWQLAMDARLAARML